MSLHQPWASLIASGQKTIETRRWRTSWRRDLLICATKLPVVPGHANGVALCIVRVADCRPMTSADETAACCKRYPRAWAWILEDLRPIEPFPVSGKHRLFDVQLPAGTTAK